MVQIVRNSLPSASVVVLDELNNVLGSFMTVADAVAVITHNCTIIVSDTYTAGPESIVTPFTGLTFDMAAGTSVQVTMSTFERNSLSAQGEGSVNFLGNSVDNLISGGGGADTLDGAGGTNSVAYVDSDAGVRIDLVLGTTSGGDAEGDVLRNFTHVFGSAFNDRISGDNDFNRLFGRDGDNFLSGRGGADYLDTSGGNDTVIGGGDNDTVQSGDGQDLILGQGGFDRLFSEEGNDTIFAGGGVDYVDSGAGDDVVYGQGDSDQIYGWQGNDTLFGGSGGDQLLGLDDDDVLYGNGNNDVLSGGSGNDTLSGGPGQDRLLGGADNDVLRGGNSRDTMLGDDGNDLLQGGGGNDALFGGGGDDTLSGGTGADRLVGGPGDDIMNGGTGDGSPDTFLFRLGDGIDRINAFDQAGNDRIELDDALWLGSGPSFRPPQDVVDTFGSLDASGTIMTLDFGGSDILEVQNADGITLATFGADITIV